MALSVSQFGSAIFYDANVNVTATALTDTNDGFNSTKVAANQDTSINGAGAAGATYYGTGLTFVSSTAMTLAVAVSTNVTAAVWCWGSTKFDTTGTQSSYRLYNDQSAIVAGDAIIVMACSFNNAAGNPTLADSQGNTYELVQSVSNADGKEWTWLVRSAKSASAIGANTITITPAVAGDVAEVGIAIVTGSPLGWVLDKPGTNSPTQAFSGTSVAGACPTASFNTSSPNEVVFAFTLVNSSVTAAGSGTTSTINPNSDCAEYKVFTTLQTGITMTVTQSTATAIYLISSIGIFPASAPMVPDIGPSAKGGYSQASLATQFIAPPAAATFVPPPSYAMGSAGAYYAQSSAALNRRIDPATFQPTPDSVLYSQPWGDGRYAQSDKQLNRRIDPATFQPNPGAIYPQPSLSGVAATAAAALMLPSQFIAAPAATFVPSPWIDPPHAAAQRIPGARGGATSIPPNPAGFQPNPQTDSPQVWSSGRYPLTESENRRVDPASFQPTPEGLFPQPWSPGAYQQSVSLNRQINPATFQPNPSAAYPPGAGSSYIAGTWVTTFIPTPPAVIASANYPTGPASPYAAATWFTPFVAPPAATFVPSAVFPLLVSVPPRVEANSVTARRIDPATFQPSPSAVFPSPWSPGSYTQSVTGVCVATPPVVNPSAYYPQRQPDQWHAPSDFVTPKWVNPALFQATPTAVYPQPWSAGAYAASPTGFFVTPPPTVNPSAIYPQRQPDQWHIGGDWATPKWIDPASFRPTPAALYVQPWSSGAYAQSSVGVFVSTPPAVNPTATYPQRNPEQWHAPGDWVTPQWIDPASFRPIPSATYPQPWAAGTYRPSELAAQRPAAPAPIQPPSAVYSTPWGSGSYARSEFTNRVQAPVVVLPTAFYPQRQPEQWHAPGDFVTTQWVNPVIYQPIPSSSYLVPWSPGSYASSVSTLDMSQLLPPPLRGPFDWRLTDEPL